MASVGARRCGRDGARGARRHDRRTSTRSTAARSRNDVLAARRGLAVVVLARVSWRGDRQSSNEAEREDDVGRRSAVRPGRRTRRTTTRSAHVDEVDAARSRNDVLAARRGLAVVVLARVSRRGDRQSSNEAEREDGVGRRSAVRPGRRTRRTTTRSAHVDEVDGGAIKERRARGSARARCRRVGSSELARR